MKTANKVGTFAVGTLVVSLAPLLLSNESIRFEPYDSLLQWFTLPFLFTLECVAQDGGSSRPCSS
jgi:hypothetical protein